MNLISVHVQNEKDFKTFCEAIKLAGLPYVDLNFSKHLLLLFYDNHGTPVGTGGLDIVGQFALLRSITVNPAWQGQQLGKQIVKYLLQAAINKQIKAVYLLTETASFFFEKLGFQTIDRSEAPSEIADTTEFAGVCPLSAVCMRLSLN